MGMATEFGGVAVTHPSGATCVALDDERWHMQHGPIDLVIGANGEAAAVRRALDAAWSRFTGVLPELVGELSRLRKPVPQCGAFSGAVAQRMLAACWPHRAQYITPMAAVAGAVADEICAFFKAEAGVRRAYVNNGGDIALHLQPGEQYRIGLYANLDRYAGGEVVPDGDFELTSSMPLRGVATSGWRGRSFSLGIADSVTILASQAAVADAAATVVANAVDSAHEAVRKSPASSLKDDTDLGDLPVTVAVGPLPQEEIEAALAKGAAAANGLQSQGLIEAAVLVLQGRVHAVGLQELNRRRIPGP